MQMIGTPVVADKAPKSRRRRYLALAPALLVVGVILPVAALAAYLYLIAADQYDSKAAFSIRSEQSGGVAQGFLGAIASVGGTGSAQDTDLLFDYIQSQAIVKTVDAKLDLRHLYREREGDWAFSLAPDAPIEDVVHYWNRMVSVSNESRDGILRVEVRAFDPEDAQQILKEILAASSDLINQLSQDARADSLRLSGDLVTETRADLQEIRRKLTDFRRENKIITPELEAESRSTLIATLQGKIAEAVIERDSILAYSNENDPRVQNIDIRLDSLRAQMEQERIDLSQSDKTADLDVYGVYESLLLEQEMLNVAYGQALANQASAHAETRRQARYVTVHVPPSFAEVPLYPQRLKILLITTVILLLIWSIVTVFYKNTRDKF
ncbi:hypothetical protein [Paracoccus zhejiangensis]|nr:hypothetical protein [Paracoccus zhejiangensis]